MGGGSKPDDLRPEADAAVVGVVGAVAEGDSDGHGEGDSLEVRGPGGFSSCFGTISRILAGRPCPSFQGKKWDFLRTTHMCVLVGDCTQQKVWKHVGQTCNSAKRV